MPDELRLLGAALSSGLLAFAFTPVAIRLAARTGFYDHPVGYKGHAAPTPYLGGAAVMAAVSLSLLAFGGDTGRVWPILACALVLFAVGTLDDKVAVPPGYRVLLEIAAAVVLWSFDFGWAVADVAAVDLGLTIAWVVAFVNAFNLMDNMDGTGSTALATSALGVGVMAAVGGDAAIGAAALAVAGGCAGFLPYNLRRGAPGRIFLGDGGSMPLGFLVAATSMNAVGADGLGWLAVVAAAMLVGVPALDTLMVVVTRLRSGVSLIQGGRDHLTHHLLDRLGTPQAVAVALALGQGIPCLLAIVATELGREAVVGAFVLCASLGLALITRLALGQPRENRPPERFRSAGV